MDNKQGQLSSHQFSQVYKDMDIDVDTLGCIMADVTPLESMKDPDEFGDKMDYLYTSKNPKRPWIKGWVAGKTAHVTLLYGLLDNGNTWKKFVDTVLKGWELKTVTIDEVGYFESQYEDEPYYCIVAHIKVTDNLLEGHERLQFLPHIDTFTGYKPHMTIAYIKKDKKQLDACLKWMNAAWKGKRLSVSPKINYGYKPGEKGAK